MSRYVFSHSCVFSNVPRILSKVSFHCFAPRLRWVRRGLRCSSIVFLKCLAYISDDNIHSCRGNMCLFCIELKVKKNKNLITFNTRNNHKSNLKPGCCLPQNQSQSFIWLEFCVCKRQQLSPEKPVVLNNRTNNTDISVYQFIWLVKTKHFNFVDFSDIRNPKYR